MKTALCAASAGISVERQQLAKRIHRKVREFIPQDLPPVAELRAIGPSVRASHRSTFQDRRVTMKCSLANALAVTVMLLLSISCLSQQNCQFSLMRVRHVLTSARCTPWEQVGRSLVTDVMTTSYWTVVVETSRMVQPSYHRPVFLMRMTVSTVCA